MKILFKNIAIVLIITISYTSCAKNTPKKQDDNSKIASTIQQTETTIRKVDTKTFQSETEGKKIQLVDVRTPKEFKSGHIENAVNVNIFDKQFMDKMAKFSKDEPVYVYCRSGGRSMKAAKKLQKNGYNVVNLNGGMIGWANSKNKVIK